mgnify:CR=1 FL=1
MSNELTCIHCGSVRKNKNAKACHERMCKENPNKILAGTAKLKSLGIRPAFFDSPEFREKQRIGSTGRFVSEERKQKQSIISKAYFANPINRENFSKVMHKTVLENPDSYSKNNVVGHVKNIPYRDGIILKGSWELLVAQTFDKIGLKWNQPSIPFEYFWQKRTHLYFPDFYLIDYDMYLEIKGYERERDRAKWSGVKNLIIFKQNEIRKIQKNQYDWVYTMLEDKEKELK